MSEHLIKPRQTNRKRIAAWVKSWAPQVKQGVITGTITLVVGVGTWIIASKAGSKRDASHQTSTTISGSNNQVASDGGISISGVSGGNNQFGNSNTMVVNPDVTNALRKIDEDHELVRSIEAVFTYDLAL